MYPGSTQPEPSRAYPSYERRGSYSHEQMQSYAYNRPHIELPRPLGPRPTLHTSLSESSGIQRRPEAFRGPLSPEYRSHHQNLPGLRDILSPGPQTGAPSSYSTAWSSNGPPSLCHQSAEGPYGQHGLHPPMALHPRADLSVRYHTQQTKPFDVPILETSPVGKHLPPSVPVSPYGGYPDSGREYSEVRPERPGQTPAGSYITNGIPSPYTSTAADETQYRSPVATYDRATNPSYAGTSPGTSADSQKKYLGVRDVPGEGSYHYYEGGHRIPTHVDGEQVNPAWGLTKANKPRKRLALACLDCREKKIKCEPGATSCLQCEKAKRTCRRCVSCAYFATLANVGAELPCKPRRLTPLRSPPGRILQLHLLGKRHQRPILLPQRTVILSRTLSTNAEQDTIHRLPTFQVKSIDPHRP